MLLSTRKGSHAEYLANYLLSFLGFTAPVPRQEDYGIDFLCSLNRNEINRTIVGENYAVQIKSSFQPLIYGKSSASKWDKSQIKFLFDLKVPFFLGVADIENDILNLYPLSPFRFIKKKHPNCTLITFNISAGGGDTIIHDIEKINLVNNLENDQGDHNNYLINLGHPLLQISSSGVKNKDELNKYIRILRECIRLEIKNIAFDDLKWPHFHWPHKYSTNNEGIIHKWIHFDDEPDISNPDLLLAENGEFINALALSFKLHNRIEEYRAMCTIARALPDFHKSAELNRKHPELYGFTPD